ncbi:MAG: sugar phosphate isomerase/epimerase [Gemmataceae bacterium]
MIACISQVTTLNAPFADDMAAATGAGFAALEVWFTKLEQHIESGGVDSTAKLLADSGLTLAAASLQGGLLVGGADRRTVHLDHFKRRLDLCQRLGIPVVVLSPGLARGAAESLDAAMKHLVEAARWAAAFGVKLALEFHGSDAFCNNLDTALNVIERCSEPNLGICLDAFHFHTGPSKTEDLARLAPGNLFHVQMCDASGPAREMLTDSDRVLPGDGDITLTPIVERLKAIGYAGAVSVELMNPVLWNVPAAQLADAARRSLERFGV